MPSAFAPIYNNIDHLMARAPEILGTHYDIAYPGKQLKTARNLEASPPRQGLPRRRALTFGQFYGWERPHSISARRLNLPQLTFGRPDWFGNVQRRSHGCPREVLQSSTLLPSERSRSRDRMP